jgi:putative spermidine/putrescine transport system substrate-binding protein
MAELSRRHFLRKSGYASLGFVSLSATGILAACARDVRSPGPTLSPGPTPSPGEATGAIPDLSGSGEVTVNSAGGTFEEVAKRVQYEPFEQASGITVNFAPGNTIAELRANILSGANTFDVFNIVSGDLPLLLKDDLLEPIDYSYFDEADVEAFDPVRPGEYSVPMMYFANNVCYDTRVFADKTPATWADLWDADTFPGPRTMYPGTFAAVGPFPEAALLADGVSPEELYPCDLDRAFRSLDRLVPNILKFAESSQEPVQLLIDGRVTVANAFNGRVQTAVDQGAPLALSWNQAIVVTNVWVVPKGARNKENAMKFIAFVSRPEPQAGIAEGIAYAPGNSRAYDIIDPARIGTLPTAPDHVAQVIVQNGDWWGAEGEPGKTNSQIVIERWQEWIAQLG